MIAHGHYSATFNPGGRFDDTPPSANLSGYDRVDQQYAYWLYSNWTSKDGPFRGSRRRPCPYAPAEKRLTRSVRVVMTRAVLVVRPLLSCVRFYEYFLSHGTRSQISRRLKVWRLLSRRHPPAATRVGHAQR